MIWCSALVYCKLVHSAAQGVRSDQACMQAWPDHSHVLQTHSSPAESVNSPLSSTLLLLLRCRLQWRSCGPPLPTARAKSGRRTPDRRARLPSTFTCDFRSGCALGWRHFPRHSFSFSYIQPEHAREWSLSLSCRASDPSPLSTRKTCRREEQPSSLDPLSQPCPDSSFRAGSPPCPIRQT